MPYDVCQLSLEIAGFEQPEPIAETERSNDPKTRRRADNQRALDLVTSRRFDRDEVFRLYTGLGGLIDAEDGEDFLAGSHKALGQYFTPPAVSRLIVEMLAIPIGSRVIDNCCGHGSMFWHLPQGCHATGIEVQEEAWRVASALFREQTIMRGDCLDYPVENQFHYALINPPFGLHWTTSLNLDLAGFGGKVLSHVACLELAVRSVVPSGYVAAILPQGALKRPDMVSFRRWYRNQTRVVAEINLPRGVFSEQGTNVFCSLVVLRKLPAPDRATFRYRVRPGGRTVIQEDEALFSELREVWESQPDFSDARDFAASIEDLGPVTLPRRLSGETVPEVSPMPVPTIAPGTALLLKKAQYSVIPIPGDVLTALKLGEIREVRFNRDSWQQTDDFAALAKLSSFYTADGLPKLLEWFEAYQIEWHYDPPLAHWIARKRRWWQRQQSVYQTYTEPADETPKNGRGRQKEAPNEPTVIDHFPEEYTANRRRLDLLGMSRFLFEYQQLDAARLAAKPFNALLYDMGLGKTRTAIATALLGGNRLILIVCLSRLVKVWVDELAKLGIDDVTVIRTARDIPALTHFTIIAYEKLSREETVALDPIECPNCQLTVSSLRCACGWKRTKNLTCPKCGTDSWKGHSCLKCKYTDRVWVPALVKRLRRIPWGMVIVDESQMIKTKNSLRSQAVASIKAKRKLLLTGTLIKGYVPDMFWQLHWCFGGGSPGFPYPWRGGAKRFIDQFATYEYVSEEYQDRIKGKKKMIPQVNNLPEFWRLMGPKVIRRLVDDPLVKQSIQLPPKNVRVVLVEMDSAQRDIYDWWYNNFVEWYMKQLEREEQDTDYTLKNAAILGQLWKLRQAATCPHIFTGEDGAPAYQGTETAKHRALLDLVDALPSKDKAVIFTGYNANAYLIAETIRTTYLIGSTPIPVRDRVIEEFQCCPAPKVLVVGLLAMNLGQTLTRARHAFMTDLDWCPSSVIQAEGRLLRISQEQPVEVTYLLSQGTIDEDIYDLIYKKQAAINEAIDHRGQTEKVTPLSIRDFVAQMLKRRKGKR